MAVTAPQAFDQFASALLLTDSQRNALRARREAIRGYLRADWTIREIIFGGSHARRTQIRPSADSRSDVDLYVILSSTHRSAYDGWGRRPTDLLDDFRRSLAYRLDTPTVRRSAPAVRITYADMLVDVVPAFRRPDGRLDLPYQDAPSGWLVATPEQQAALFTSLNGRCGHLLKPVIRMAKHWRSLHPSLGLRSYHLEVLAYGAFYYQGGTFDLRHGVRHFFEEAEWRVRGDIWDPGGSGNSVSDYLSLPGRIRASQMFGKAASSARAAINAPDWATEIAGWRRLLGSRFPAYG